MKMYNFNSKQTYIAANSMNIATTLFSIGLIMCLLAGFKNEIHAQEVDVQVLVSSDVHGRFFPMRYSGVTSSSSLAKVSTYVKRQRSAHKNSVILLDNGDFMQGTSASYYAAYHTQGELFTQLLSYLNYDAMTIGNHDIECGPAVYNHVMKNSSTSILGANVLDSRSDKSYFRPYVMLERQGVRIAVLGLTTPSVPNWLPPFLWEHMSFQAMHEAAAYWMDIIQNNEKPDAIIGLFHSGIGPKNAVEAPFEQASAYVAEQVPGFDLVLTGHDHGLRKEWIVNTAGDSVLLLGPRHFAEYLAHARLRFKKDEKRQWKLMDVDGEIVSVQEEPNDPNFMLRFADQILEIEEWASQPIARVTKEIHTIESLFGPSTLTDLVHHVQLKATDADISFTAPLAFDDTLYAGMWRRADFFVLYPYENYLYTMQLSGAEIEDYLQYSHAAWHKRGQHPESGVLQFRLNDRGEPDLSRSPSFRLKKPYFNFDSAGGLQYTVDVQEGDSPMIHIEALSNGKAWSRDSLYRVAINSYRGSGGGDLLTEGAGISHDQLSSRIVKSSNTEIRNLLMSYFENQGDLNEVPNHGQWKLIPEQAAEIGQKLDLYLLRK